MIETQTAQTEIDIQFYYEKYSPMVLRRCRRLLHNEELALDAMQDTFVKLIRNKEKLTHEAPSGLLYRMATNTCLNRIRSLKRHPETYDEQLVYSIASLSQPEKKTGAKLMLEKLFGKEKESTEVIAVLHYLDGMTLEEVALEVNMSVSGVRKRLRGLRERLNQLDTMEEKLRGEYE